MNWCRISIERLRTHRKRQQALISIPEQIKSLEEQFAAIRSATTDATPVQDNSNRREDMLVYNIAKREELRHNYSIVTVSYTHLDVYKRQEYRPNIKRASRGSDVILRCVETSGFWTSPKALGLLKCA